MQIYKKKILMHSEFFYKSFDLMDLDSMLYFNFYVKIWTVNHFFILFLLYELLKIKLFQQHFFFIFMTEIFNFYRQFFFCPVKFFNNLSNLFLKSIFFNVNREKTATVGVENNCFVFVHYWFVRKIFACLRVW